MKEVYWPTVARERKEVRALSKVLPRGSEKDLVDSKLRELNKQASKLTRADKAKFKEQKREGFVGDVFTMNKEVSTLYKRLNHLNVVRQGLLTQVRWGMLREMLDNNLKEIQDIDLELHQLEVDDETQDAYRAVQLLNMRKQAESGYVATEGTSGHKAFILQQIKAQHPTLLEGPTGTGKTELLVSLVKEQFGVEPEVLRCTDRTGPAEIFGKVLLSAGLGGSTETYFQPGVLTRCLEKNIPLIMDEFNNLPLNMRFALKELYNRREGQRIIIQEDSGRAIVVPSNFTFLATANLKGDKHKERFEFDDAEMRVFASEHVGYMPEVSQYDIALAILMNKDGSLSLSAYEAGTVLSALVKTAKDTQDAYTGKSTITDPSSGERATLLSAVFDPGQLFAMVKAYANVASEKGFVTHLNESIMRFVDKGAYAKDRPFLVQLFTKNGFLQGKTPEDFVHGDITQNHLSLAGIFHLDETNEGHPSLNIQEVAQLDPYEVRKQRVQIQGASFLKSAPQVEGTISLDDAIRVLGAENVIGPQDLREVWGYIPDSLPPINLTEQDLLKMEEMEHKLVLRYDKGNNGNPLTMLEMNKYYGGLGGKLFRKIEWYKDQVFFTNSTSELGWYEVSSYPIGGTGGKNYFEQTKVVAQYVKERFEGQKMQDEYMNAISDIEVLARGTVMEELMSKAWSGVVIKKVVELQINQLFRRSAPEVIQDFINQYKKNGDRGALGGLYDWTSTHGIGGFVFLGSTDAGIGADVGMWIPSSSRSDVLTFFSRRL